MRHRIYLFAGIASLFAVCAFAADQPASAPTLTYTHLYTDSNGVTHFKEGKLGFEASRPGGPLRHALMDKTGAAFLWLKAGQKEDWHVAPQRWLLVSVQGTSEVTASDGQVRRFPPGSIVLMDDTTGKGHITHAVGRTDHIALVVPVTDLAALSK